jgi:hypothetical protein
MRTIFVPDAYDSLIAACNHLVAGWVPLCCCHVFVLSALVLRQRQDARLAVVGTSTEVIDARMRVT